MQVTSKISSGCQITLPSAFRKALGFGAGDDIVMEDRDGGILIKKAMTREEKLKQMFADLDEWRENLPDETKELIKKHAGWTVNQYHEYYDNLPETKEYIRKKYGVQGL